MKNILIISGGSLDVSWAVKWLKNKSFEYVIAVDSGLEYADALRIRVDFLLGDFDSVKSDILKKYKDNTKNATYPTDKDYTDTHIAIRRAIEMGAEAICLIGATGTRLDHVMTNITVMKEAMDNGVLCEMYDKYNRIYLLSADKFSTHRISRDEQYGDYVSFVPVTAEVCLSIEGVKYPLDGYNLLLGESICQSNKIVSEYALISVHKGILAAYETKDL